MQTFVKMYPQAELENYKLQVELLQEKLQRSEENRQQLEHKLEKILHKRNELEKSMRHKTRQKYQEFLDEQKKRNERNKTLVQMLERIDQQTAAMSERSERLKMMKLQYQMYFAKLVQKQTMQCLQQTATPTAIPVLVPTATATAAATTPLQPTTATNKDMLETSMARIPTKHISNMSDVNGNALSPAQQWTLAMATPTRAGMLLRTPTPTATAAAGGALSDYLQYPIGYMPRTNVGLDDLYAATQVGSIGNSSHNIYDLRASLRAIDNENVDLPERFMARSNAADLRHKSTHDMDNFVDETLTGEYHKPPAAHKDNSLHANQQQLKQQEEQQQKQQLTAIGADDREFGYGSNKAPSTALTSAGSLTFDKLPQTSKETKLLLAELKSATGTDTGMHWQQPQEQNIRRNVDVDSQPQMTTKELQYGVGVEGVGNASNSSTLPNSRVSSVEQEKSSSSVAVNNEKAPQTADIAEQRNEFDARFAALKIDEPWQGMPTTATKSWQPEDDNPIYKPELSTNANNALTNEPHDENASVAPVVDGADEHLTRSNNQLSVPLNSAPAGSVCLPETLAKPTLSIENIENAIYGELLNQTTTPTTTPAAATAVIAEVERNLDRQTLSAAQGLFENLVTTQAPQIQEPAGTTTVPTTYELQQQQPGADYGNYDATNYGNAPAYEEHSTASESYEPSYATIDGNTMNEAAASVEPIYSEIGNPTDYQQYNIDANSVSGITSGADGVGEPTQSDPYANMDYSNYNATQYTDAFDPNAYPGYIYDETTGQYIADPNADAYATDENYAVAAQNYDEAAANYDYSSAQYAQQAATEDGNTEGYVPEQIQSSIEPTNTASVVGTNDDISAKAADTNNMPQDDMTSATAPAAVPETTASTPSTPPITTAATPKIVKPTSILASSDKQSASNDAQQKKKKRVNFVDSSETDESSSAKPAQQTGDTTNSSVGVVGTRNPAVSSGTVGGGGGGDGSESDFDFSTGSEAQN